MSARLDEAKQRCLAAKRNAYNPYSKFAVGCALIGDDNQIYIGANVENCAFPTTICAETAAIGAAVTAGCRSWSYAVVSGGKEGHCWPCGNCRQFLSEFGNCTVVSLTDDGDTVSRELHELLPMTFDVAALKTGQTK